MNTQKTIITLFIAIVSIIWMNYRIAQTSSNQPPIGHTGAPGETTCATAGCHSGPATFNPTILAIGTVPFNQFNNGYIPNFDYNITVTNNTQNKTVYGFSLTVLDAQGNKAGEISLSNPSVTSLQIPPPPNNREYVGHNNASSTNAWTFKWKAPSENIGPVTFYAASNAGDGVTPLTGATILTSTLTVEACVQPVIDSITLVPPVLCTDSIATITVHGQLNDATQWILYSGSCASTIVASNTSGVFQVQPPVTTTYFIRGFGGCVNTGGCQSVVVGVGVPEDASFSYSKTTYCSDEADPKATITGTPGGTFSASPAGLILDADSGIINLSSSLAGQYTITYTTQDTVCTSSESVLLTIYPVYQIQVSDFICDGDSYTFGTQTLTTGGTFTESFTSSAGCDSTVTLTLSVIAPDLVSMSASICDGESYPLGTQNLTASGVYFETFASSLGCDSVVELQLTVIPADEVFVSDVVCAGGFYLLGSQTLTSGGVYTETFTSSVTGCDSIVELTLSVIPAPVTAISDTICQGETYTLGSQNLTISGFYSETFSSPAGCDSIVELSLHVIPVDVVFITDSICPGDTYVLGTQHLTAPGTYTELFSLADGCDSVVELTLNFIDVELIQMAESICAGESFTLGSQILTESGVFIENFSPGGGCDSIVELALTVIDVDITVTQDEAELTAQLTGANYQWLDCNAGFAPIEGETDRVFTATVSGSYAVAINDGSCTDTSECFTVTLVGTQSLSLAESKVLMYPNPLTSGQLTIQIEYIFDGLTVEVMDLNGRMISREVFNHQNMLFISLPERGGVYFIRLMTEDGDQLMLRAVRN